MNDFPDSATHQQGVPTKVPGSVLFVQHARGLGGSAVSLRYLVESMCLAGMDCTVALAQPSRLLEEFYAQAGIRTLTADGLVCWHHSTVAQRKLTNPRHLLELGRVSVSWRSARDATLRLVDRIQPDIVHLNSMPLSASAQALTEAALPYVWHVREPSPDQGFRTAFIRSLMQAAPACVFITEYDRQQWLGASTAAIVPNAVPDFWFNTGQQPRPLQTPVKFAFLGGLKMAPKGASVLLDALRILARTNSRWQCVMPGALTDVSDWTHRLPLGGLARAVKIGGLSEKLMAGFQVIGPAVQLLPPTAAIHEIMKSMDFVVFPSVTPHFPRPVIEAAALGLPAVGSDVGGVNGCILHEETGLLSPAGNAQELALALEKMIEDSEFRLAAGKRAYSRALDINTLSAQQKAIARIYSQVLQGSKRKLPDG